MWLWSFVLHFRNVKGQARPSGITPTTEPNSCNEPSNFQLAWTSKETCILLFKTKDENSTISLCSLFLVSCFFVLFLCCFVLCLKKKKKGMCYSFTLSWFAIQPLFFFLFFPPFRKIKNFSLGDGTSHANSHITLLFLSWRYLTLFNLVS